MDQVLDWLDWFDSAFGVGVLAVLVPLGGYLLSIVARIVIAKMTGSLFSELTRGLNKSFSAATLTSVPTNGSITLRQILNGQLGQTSSNPADPAERIKVLEELHSQGGITADKLAKLKASIEAGG